MQNGQPPFVPPAGMPMPPFPPNVQPGQMPPFRPNFVPPPFPPNFTPSPNAGGQGTPPPGWRPPPGLYPPPNRPGLGLPSLPNGMPQPPHMSSTGAGPAGSSASPGGGGHPGFVKEVKTTKVFVGSISPGITDATLEELLNAAGPLHELKRVSGASGKPQAFGFAAFESPEVVMRTIRCLNGIELPDLSPEGKAQGKPPKALVVKVDDKTREFLDEFEETLGRTEDDERADSLCRKGIKHIVARLTDPNAPRPPELGEAPSGPTEVFVPAHLQDLKEGDLPENQRVAVLDQIAVFREASARRDREKKRAAEERERFQRAQQMDSSTADYGYGANRGFQAQVKKERTWGQPSNQQQQHSSPATGSAPTPNGRQRDPQAYDQPVGFVKAQAPESKEQSERTDEEEEMMRQQRKIRERDNALKEKERRVEGAEWKRIDGLNRELAARKSHAEWEERHRAKLEEDLRHWDDDKETERGRELFYADRRAWRKQRQQVRRREYQQDMRDRQDEEEERRVAEAESEAFMQKQMAEMAELEAKQKARGLLTEDAPMIKLALDAQPDVKEEKKKTEAPAPRPSVAFGDGDDDDDFDGPKRKQRTLVKLEYDEKEKKGGDINEAEMAARRNARLLDIRSQVPRDQRRLWNMDIEWAAITPQLVESKIKPFVGDKIKASLGEADEDLLDFVLENIRDRKRPNDIIDGLEPVLDEEATPLTVQLWRLLAFETAAYQAGIESGTMTV